MQILNLPLTLDAMHMILSSKFVRMTSMSEFKQVNLGRFWFHREADPWFFFLFLTTSKIIFLLFFISLFTTMSLIAVVEHQVL